jgi:hypothetical protein
VSWLIHELRNAARYTPGTHPRLFWPVSGILFFAPSSSRNVIRITRSSRNTLKELFRRLVEKRHLVRHGVGKGSWYVLPWPTVKD